MYISALLRRTFMIALVTFAIGGLIAVHKTTAIAHPASARPSLFEGLAWRLVGPFRGGWSEMVEGIPSQPDVFYFGAAGGGVWRTRNAGRTWVPLFDRGNAAPVGALAIAPSDPRTIYIGTGQPEPRYDVAGGVGVFKSSDGGKTWVSAGLHQTRHIGRIWVDPTDAKTVIVAAVGHLFGRNSERGVFRSTDGGNSWSHVLAINDDTGAVDLAADPREASVLFAAAWQARQYPWQSYFSPIGGPGSGIYKSVDGGITWSRLTGRGWPPGPLGRISLATTRTTQGSLRVYAVVSAGAAGGLYRSDDGGSAWTRVNGEPAFTSDYASRITVAPDDPNVVYVVGQSIRRCSDGGRTCIIVKGAPGGDDYHGVWINPAHPDHIATVSDQGTAISVDGGASWSSWYNQPTGQFYHLATDDRFPYWIYSGQQDSGTVAIASRSDYGSIGYRDWHPVGGDERDDDIPDPHDPRIVYASGLGGTVTRYDSRTGDVAFIGPYPMPNYGQRQTLTKHHFVWVTPMAISRRGPLTLYLGGEVLFASTDRGTHWSTISPDLTGKRAGATGCNAQAVDVAVARQCGYGAIWSIAASSRHAGEIWVGTDDGLIQLTRDAGRHWTNVTPRGIPRWAKVAAIDVSQLRDGTAYAAIDNQRQDDLAPHVWKTHDYGRSWQTAAGDLPHDHFVNVVRADPVRAGLLYAGTEVGVFVSPDDGQRWLPLQRDLPTASVRDLLVHDDDLIAATQGRALWVLDDLRPLRDSSAATLATKSAYLFSPAPAYRVQPNNNRDTPLPADEPAGKNPPQGAIIDYWLGKAADGPVQIEILDSAGNLVARLSSNPPSPPTADVYFSGAWLKPVVALSRAPGMHRVTWNLRYTRPRAITYDYSIAAIAGEDTPLTPSGKLVLPGTYRVRLRVNGSISRATLLVRQDPRTDIHRSDLIASLELWNRIAQRLARARRGYVESAAVREQLAAVKTQAASSEPALRIATRFKQIRAATTMSSFERASAVLAAIETNLESNDRAPTQPQRQIALETMARVDTLWNRWETLRNRDLGRLNASLKAAGSKPVVLP